MASQTTDAKNLAFTDPQIQPLNPLTGHFDPQIADRKGDLTIRRFEAARWQFGALNFASDHQLRNTLNFGFVLGHLRHDFTVAQDGNVMTDTHHFVQTVRNKQNGDPFRSQPAHRVQQVLCFAFRQHGGGFVKYQQLNILFINFASDFHKLLIADRQTCHRSPFINRETELFERRPRIFAHRGYIQRLHLGTQNAADHVLAGDFPVQLNVLGYRETWQQHKFLMDHANSKFHGTARRFNPDAFSVKHYFTVKTAGFMDYGHSEQDVHQGGFAGSVLTDQCVNFARPD